MVTKKKYFLIVNPISGDMDKSEILLKTLAFAEEYKIEIVPKELSHDLLLNKFDIDDDILKFYYSPTRQLILDVEYQKMKDSG